MRDLVCEVPEGRIGDWAVKRFEITEEEVRFASLRATVNPSAMGRGFCETGTFTRLTRNGSLIMSDTDDEMRDFTRFVKHAKGLVLINGLGLGMTVEAFLRNRMVRKVVAVEIEKDVIDLVGRHYLNKWGSGLEIFHADALTWKNPIKTKFDIIWHDIWDNICADNLDDMKKLHRRYGRWLAVGGEQRSWCREECRIAEKRSW